MPVDAANILLGRNKIIIEWDRCTILEQLTPQGATNVKRMNTT